MLVKQVLSERREQPALSPRRSKFRKDHNRLFLTCSSSSRLVFPVVLLGIVYEINQKMPLGILG